MIGPKGVNAPTVDRQWHPLHSHAIAAKNDVEATHERIDRSPNLGSSVGQENSLFRASHRPPGGYPKTGVISGLADYTTATRIEMQSINEDKDS
jgi:hypothetical protein